MVDIIDKMPKIPSPDALGLNDNSAVLKHTADTENLLQGVVLTSPTSSSGKDSKEDDNKAKKQSSKSKDATSKVRNFFHLLTSGTYIQSIRISAEFQNKFIYYFTLRMPQLLLFRMFVLGLLPCQNLLT